MWEMKYRGVMQTNNSTQVSHTGYGSGGTIDGLWLEETAIRGPAANALDPTVPLLYTGTIEPPPVSTNLFFDNFDNGVQGWWVDHPCGSIRICGTNQQLYTWANWSNCAPDFSRKFFTADHLSTSWNLADGQTLECQADLVRISEDTFNGALINVGGDSRGEYIFYLTQAGAGLHKFTPSSPGTMFWWDTTVRLARTNLVLYLALTRDKANLIITTRVLDKANQNAVLFERTFVDTPAVDTSLTISEFRALTGLTNFAGLTTDPGGPLFSGNKGDVGVWQFTDVLEPPVEAVWDNFAIRLHDVPPLNITKAVQVTYTAPSEANYAVEVGPTVLGPWAPIQELPTPGLQRLAVPLSGPAQFFRLVRSP